jgi:phosphopantetheinyl transferase (holo-ACP synthase)
MTTMGGQMTRVLSEFETAQYEDNGSAGAGYRATVWAEAEAMAYATGRPVEIHSCDGVTFAQVLPETGVRS